MISTTPATVTGTSPQTITGCPTNFGTAPTITAAVNTTEAYSPSV